MSFLQFSALSLLCYCFCCFAIVFAAAFAAVGGTTFLTQCFKVLLDDGFDELDPLLGDLLLVVGVRAPASQFGLDLRYVKVEQVPQTPRGTGNITTLEWTKQRQRATTGARPPKT